MFGYTLKDIAQQQGLQTLTTEEAFGLYSSEPAIIASPGYYHLHDGEGGYFYLAMGPLPGCLRGGSRVEPTTKIKGPHYQLNLKQLISLKGFYPHFYYTSPLIRYQSNARDYSVDFDHLIQLAVESNLTKEQLHSKSVALPFWGRVLTQHTEQYPTEVI